MCLLSTLTSNLSENAGFLFAGSRVVFLREYGSHIFQKFKKLWSLLIFFFRNQTCYIFFSSLRFSQALEYSFMQNCKHLFFYMKGASHVRFPCLRGCWCPDPPLWRNLGGRLFTYLCHLLLDNIFMFHIRSITFNCKFHLFTHF